MLNYELCIGGIYTKTKYVDIKNKTTICKTQPTDNEINFLRIILLNQLQTQVKNENPHIMQ